MIAHRFVSRAIVTALACLGTSCNFGSSMPADPTSVPFPMKPSPPATPPTETFSGDLAFAGSGFHSFTTTQTGVIDVTLPSLGQSTAMVLLGVGVPLDDGSGCKLSKFPTLVTSVGAGPWLALPAESQSAGVYCVGIDDYFNKGPFTYTIQVWHN